MHVPCAVLCIFLCLSSVGFAAEKENATTFLAKVEAALNANKPTDARPYLVRLEAMELSLSEAQRVDFYFYNIDALYRMGDKENALIRAKIYLKKYGPNGKNSTKVQEIIARLSSKVAAQALNGSAAQHTKTCPECIEMVRIPPGTFDMGSNNGEPADRPVHRVQISEAFEIGKYEVTQLQWEAIMGSNPSKSNACRDDCPVRYVSWNDAQSFINKLNAKTNKRYRLPTEAEWEYACRAGGKHQYCGGDDAEDVGWVGINSNNTIHPVGQKRANAFGVYDMTGNVSEWVADSFHLNYSGAPTDGSEWRGDGEKRVMRGSSFVESRYFARLATRNYYPPAEKYQFFGLRLARSIP